MRSWADYHVRGRLPRRCRLLHASCCFALSVLMMDLKRAKCQIGLQQHVSCVHWQLQQIQAESKLLPEDTLSNDPF